MKRRRAGRVIVADHDGCVLLAGASTADEGGAWWFTPGGGTDSGESPRDAARRELTEETGIRVPLDDPPVLHRRARFVFLGHRTEQVETFWYARLDDRPEVASQHLEDYEAEAIDHWAWWSPAQLTDLASRERVFPACLPRLLDHLREGDRDGLPWVEEHLGHEPTPPRPVDPAALPDWAQP